MKITEDQFNKVEYSQIVTDRFIELCQSGKIMYPDEVKILTFLAEKYQPHTIAEYAKSIKKQYKTVREWVNKRRLAFQKIGSVVFVLKSLN